MSRKSFDPADLGSIPDLPGVQTSWSPPPPKATTERGPTRASLEARRRLAMIAGLAWLGVLVLVLGLRNDLTVSPLVLAHVGLPALLGACALYAALSPGRAGLGPSARTTVALAVGAPLAFALAAVVFPRFDDGHRLAAAFFCGDFGLLLGAVPLAALAWAQKRTCATSAPWRSALVGVSMGLIGAATLGMHCANGDGLHVALGHGWPVAVLGSAGFLLVSRVTRVR